MFRLTTLLCTLLAAPAAAELRYAVVPDVDRAARLLDLDSGELVALPPDAVASAAGAAEAARAAGDLAYDHVSVPSVYVTGGRSATVDLARLDATGLVRDLLPQTHLEGDELAPGAGFAVITRSGRLAVLHVIDADAERLTLAWVTATAAERGIAEAELAALRNAAAAPQRGAAALPPWNDGRGKLLDLETGELAALPQAVQDDPPARRAAEAAALGDLIYRRGEAGGLLALSGHLLRIGRGPLERFFGRDYGAWQAETMSGEAAAPERGAVFLVATRSGLTALLRLGDTTEQGLGLAWALQTNGSAFFPPADRIAHEKADASLTMAVSSGNADATRRALAAGADANGVAYTGLSMLQHAALSGDAQTLAALLAAGADPDLRNAEGWTALHVAAKLGNLRLVEELLRAGADPDAVTAAGESAVSLAAAAGPGGAGVIAALEAAGATTGGAHVPAQTNDVGALAGLLRSGAADLDARDAGGDTALLLAAKSGSTDALRLLLEAGADPSLEGRFGDGDALSWAVRHGHGDAAAVLIEQAGLDTGSLDRALYEAIANDRPELVAPLVRAGADPQRRTRGTVPLNAAFQYGSAGMVSSLEELGYEVPLWAVARVGSPVTVGQRLAAGEAVDEARSPGGRTALHQAVGAGRDRTVDLLLAGGADPDLTDAEGRNALHVAVAHADLGTLRRLLAISDGIDARDAYGRTPLFEAVARRRTDLVQYLVAAGADTEALPPGYESVNELTGSEEIRRILGGGGP